MATAQELILKSKARNYRLANPLPKVSRYQEAKLNQLSLMYYDGKYSAKPKTEDLIGLVMHNPTKKQMFEFLEVYR